jgi:DNA primase
MKNAYARLNGEDLIFRLDELKADFRDLIFNDDLLLPTFQEAKKLCQYLEGMGLSPYLICSSSKGFHVNIFYEEARLPNLSQVSRLFGKTFANKLNLKYLDYAVFDRKKAQRRLQRCQYKFHSRTDLMTIPIPDLYDYDEFMQTLKKKISRPIEFDFNEYSSKSEEFRESLIYNDKLFSKRNARRERDLKKENDEKRRLMKKRYGANYKNYSDISMVDLFNQYGGEIIKEDSEKVIVRCPFHSDRNPSAVIFKNSNYFHCSSCGKTLNYYAFISEMEGTEDHSEIMSKVEEFMK